MSTQNCLNSPLPDKERDLGLCTYCDADYECMQYQKDGCQDNICFDFNSLEFSGAIVDGINEFMAEADTDKSGGLSRKEVEEVFKKVEHEIPEEGRPFVIELLETIGEEDLNHDDQLSVDEISRAVFMLTDPWSPFRVELPDWFTTESVGDALETSL